MLLCLFLAIVTQIIVGGVAFQAKPVPLVLPEDAKSKLLVQNDGLDVLREISGPVSPVVVIGPYRTGKSFLLNQLLGVSCEQGFGVGHTRHTETKGIWLYGQPQEKTLPDGSSLSIVYIDTEGFESTGKSNAYDDRIFALATILSSVLIYNLPETIRESDIAKLSFAVELAQGFYDRYQGQDGSFDSGAMLWLIQHDFLEGLTTDEMVRQALSPVANPHNDPEIDSLNRIRASLTVLAGNSTGYSLPQPHLQRTRLCQLADSELDPKYLEQRDALRGVVKGLAKPKVLGGRQMTGRQLADLLVKMVALLNAQEIPHVSTMIESFNRQIADKLIAQYKAKLAGVAVPIDEAELKALDAAWRRDAEVAYGKQMLGRNRGVAMQKELVQTLSRESTIRVMENAAASDELCSELESACEARLDDLQDMQLPSMRKFEASFEACNRTLNERCLGPAKQVNSVRLQRAWSRAQALFATEYNNRLYTGLLVVCIAAVVLFRFVIRIRVCEALGWVGFIVLEVAPHVYPGPDGMYGSQAWQTTVQVWEAAMFLVFGFDGAWILWLLLLVALVVLRVVRQRGLLQWGGRSIGKKDLPPGRSNGKKVASAGGLGAERDLAV